MDWTPTAIAAGAAVVASGLTGLITLRATKASLKQNSDDLGTQLDHESGGLDLQLRHERAAAREDRDQERRKDAYVSLLKYASWRAYDNLVLWRIASRGIGGVRRIRGENDWKRTPDSAKAERDAFFGAKPTDAEQKELDAAPTGEERATTDALVTAVASDAVFKAFEQLLSKDQDFRSRYRALVDVLRQEPEPPPAVDELGTAAALSENKDAGEFAIAEIRFSKASDEFHDAVKEIQQLVRTELNHPPSA
jgi:hypothetical protein